VIRICRFFYLWIDPAGQQLISPEGHQDNARIISDEMQEISTLIPFPAINLNENLKPV
jgi:hypothetical protein